MRLFFTIIVLSITWTTLVQAQALPPTSRTVFKCNLNGKVTYSDAPCLGAERIEIDPSRGVGKASGADVQRERQRELVAEALRPLTGMNARQLDVAGRRMKLSPEAQRDCRVLGEKIPELEGVVARASAEQRDPAALQLLSLRSRFRELRC